MWIEGDYYTSFCFHISVSFSLVSVNINRKVYLILIELCFRVNKYNTPNSKKFFTKSKIMPYCKDFWESRCEVFLVTFEYFLSSFTISNFSMTSTSKVFCTVLEYHWDNPCAYCYGWQKIGDNNRDSSSNIYGELTMLDTLPGYLLILTHLITA